MFLNMERKFFFRCKECYMVLSAEFKEQEQIQKIEEDELVLECPCGEGYCELLRD